MPHNSIRLDSIGFQRLMKFQINCIPVLWNNPHI